MTNPTKPGKNRIVFDAAASHKGTSLNHPLVTGLYLLNSLVGVLMRFKLHAIALIADIEPMFFLWGGADLERPPEVYQM